MKKKFLATSLTALALMMGIVTTHAASSQTSAYTSATATSGSFKAKYTTGGWAAWDNYSFTASSGSTSGNLQVHAKDKGDNTWENQYASGKNASIYYPGGTWAANIGSYAYAGSARVDVVSYN